MTIRVESSSEGNLSGHRVVVMGLGRFGGGVGAVRYLVRRGAQVLVTDTLGAERMSHSLRQLEDLDDVEYRLDGHDIRDFTNTDMVVVNPAVDRRKNHFLRAACATGARLTSEIELLVCALPNRDRTIAVTGTAGKSTVTAMIAHVLGQPEANQALEPAQVWMGGNIGGSLLGQIDAIAQMDWVVLELSSFMLESIADVGFSPRVAIVTNLAPNHLDRHVTFNAYIQAKQVILRYQQAGDVVVFGPNVAQVMDAGLGQLDQIEAVTPLLGPLHLPGHHNRINGSLAIAAVGHCAVAPHFAAAALENFPGLPHRTQQVANVAAVRCYNDSKSTTPESACLAIDAFDARSVHVILGGYDKGSDLRKLILHAARRCRGIYTIGDTGQAITAAAAAEPGGAYAIYCGNLECAVREALRHARDGEVLLLSPGCASWDQFENYEQRGDMFTELVRSHADAIGHITSSREGA